MGAGNGLKERFGRVRTHLTSLDEQRLGQAALVIILLLDLFFLIAIFNGLDAHTGQLSTPDDRIPHSCREIVINSRWNAANRTDNLSQIVLSFSRSYHLPDEKKRERHPLCQPYTDLVEQIRDDRTLAGLFEERSRLEGEAKVLQGGIEGRKGAYDTSLLETMAGEQAGQGKVEALKSDVRQKTAALNDLRSWIASLEGTINGDARVKLLWERLQGLQDRDRLTLIADLRQLNFWFPVKRLAMQMVFLLPLFAVLYGWNGASIRKNRGVQTLVSSHLLVLSFIPMLGKIVETIYDIIPKILLKRLIDLLESLKLVAVWHYLVIALAVVAALLLIYLFQRKLFSPEKLMERRIAKGECQACGKRLPAGSQACPFCGSVQFESCRHCGKPRHVRGKYCRECGKPSAA